MKRGRERLFTQYSAHFCVNKRTQQQNIFLNLISYFFVNVFFYLRKQTNVFRIQLLIRIIVIDIKINTVNVSAVDST